MVELSLLFEFHLFSEHCVVEVNLLLGLFGTLFVFLLRSSFLAFHDFLVIVFISFDQGVVLGAESVKLARSVLYRFQLHRVAVMAPGLLRMGEVFCARFVLKLPDGVVCDCAAVMKSFLV